MSFNVLRNRATESGLILAAAVFILVSGNGAFFSRVLDVYPLQLSNLAFLASLAGLTVALLVFLMSLISLLFPARFVASLFLALSAPIAYVAANYGTIIDTAMIQNILETDTGEAMDLLNPFFLLRLLMFGVLPIALVWYWPVKPTTLTGRLRDNAILGSGALMIVVLCVLTFGGRYADFFREHKALRYYANPIFAVWSIGNFVAASISTADSHELAAVLTAAAVPATDRHKEMVILVVGETARADHFSLNGYERETNPLLANESRLVSYTDVSACGTSTAVSLPCIFSPKSRADFTRNAIYDSENLLDILRRVGVNVLWRDNNSGSKGVATRVQYEAFNTPDVNPACDDQECRDIGLLSGLQDFIDSADGDIFIVLHQMGSHGPAYYRRYPPAFEKFQPACTSSDLSKCDDTEIRNAYDNTILYTDYFLSEVIALLKRNTPAYETTMLYIGDHGESLGENGIYLHGLPYWMAPVEQTRVPLILWSAPTSDIDILSAAARKDMPHTHDSIFNSLLLTFEVDETLPDMPQALYKVIDDNG
tara:strand:- start:1438 stop:3054 length:1617 start_codon:yes stop_codon:yes gene_type:complete